ncbi:MAG TPA: aspartate-semialdehyde dehydrogenase [bacterium]|nr:aspartate-semialdehyde dehydrogenase [bacterium]HPN31909.1 aspartate-semialdehyde dehydrogenase [bacterium]
MKNYYVAVAGATGAVGTEMIKCLEDRKFPVSKIKLLASSKSVGKKLSFCGEEIAVEELKHDSFKGVDIALFSAGGDRSLEFAPSAAKDKCVVIDNSSAFRMDKETPLVVPEVNPEDAKKHKHIIANPNCSTIQMVVALKPIQNLSKIKNVIVSTYQSVSGAGAKGMDELMKQTAAVANKTNIPAPSKFAHRIAFNCIPHIDSFIENRYTKEEMKMVNETRKILGDNTINVSPTTVRVPVFRGHSESVTVITERKITRDEAISAFSKASGIIVQDDPFKAVYPLATESEGKYDTFVGRIREDIGLENALTMWIVSDNLLKGAASNAVQIAELLVERSWL